MDWILAVEPQNKSGYIVLNGEYTDLITGRLCSGKTQIPPYGVLVLKR